MTSPNEQQQVRGAIKAWRHNRLLYPGWLVTPQEKRTVIWNNTRYWIDKIVEYVAIASPHEATHALDDLLWRLDRCLLPLPRIVRGACETLVNRFDPFQKSHLSEPACATISENESSPYDVATIRDAWLRICLYLLRDARLMHDTVAFPRWVDRLSPFGAGRAPLGQAIEYERCLDAIYSVDYTRLRTYLDHWETSAHDPMWGVRKASLLAEIGELTTAEKLVEDSIRDIRRQLRLRRDDVGMLSREGWSLWLLWSIRQAMNLSKGPSTDIQIRFEELNTKRCNPMPELSYFQSALAAPPQKPSPSIEEHVGFHPGERHVTHRWSAREEEHPRLTAWQYLRLTEVAAIRSTIGTLGVGARELERAAEWLKPLDLEAAIRLWMRAGSSSAIAMHLHRSVIARLPEDASQRLRAQLIATTSSIFGSMKATGSVAIFQSFPHLSSRPAAIIDLLSRLVVRARDEDLEALFDLGISLYQSEIMRKSVGLPRELSRFFKELANTYAERLTEYQMMTLLRLPLPHHDGFQVPYAEIWPEPVWALTDAGCRIHARTLDLEWRDLIGWLLRAGVSENRFVRERALHRLIYMHDSGILNSDEMIQLGESIWNRVSLDSHLPADTGLNPAAFITLPAPQDSHPLERFRRYCCNSRLPRFRRGDGKIQGTVDAEGMLGDVYRTGKRAWIAEGKTKWAIQWSQHEIVCFLAEVERWWVEEGLDIWKKQLPLVSSSLEERCHTIIRFLAEIAIPNLLATSNEAARAVQLVDALDSAGMRVELALPMVLIIEKQRAATTVTRLRHAIVGSDEATLREAVEGLGLWARCFGVVSVPDPTMDLFYELGNTIMLRRHPACYYAIRSIPLWVRITKEGFRVLDSRMLEMIGIGLEYLEAEASYVRTTEGSPGSIPIDWVHEYRLLATRAAAALKWGLNVEIESINRWLEAAKSDPLPEIRREAVDTFTIENA